ncbi:MAG: PD-(D/E)XK nuclease family protein [Phycicoccus sp.]
MTAEPELTTAQLLLAWDRRRARSQQREFGMSELGQCRRRAGYRLHGVLPTDTSGSVQAVMGTAVHSAVESVHQQMQADGLIPADDLVEHEVRFAGLLGHLDRYVTATATLRDVKTTTSRWLSRIRVHGPPESTLWQVNTYAAALIAEGRPVRRIVVDYLARDTGDEHSWVGQFDPLAVREALAWVKTVRETPLEWLSRDHEPDSSWCQHCPFRTRCWDGAITGRDPRSVLHVEDPDTPRWVDQLEQARAAKAAAAAAETEARGALDAVRPDWDGGDTVTVDVGDGRLLRWRRTVTRRVDVEAARAEYARAGASAPTVESVSTRVELVSAEEVVGR